MNHNRLCFFISMIWVCIGPVPFCPAEAHVKSPIVDTGQIHCYDNHRQITCPSPGSSFFGQDAQYTGNLPSYKDNGDGTITDLVTGLVWSKTVDETKLSLVEAQKIAGTMVLAGYSDWRVPDIKELYSLINFCGNTGSHKKSEYKSIPDDAVPYINTDYFDFRYGNTGTERFIDAQWLSSTRYVSTTMGGAVTLFGVNFADGRIKGYGYQHPKRPHREKKFYARYVRGPSYGQNDFLDNGDGTVTDRATGLMWMKTDSQKGMNWQEALSYAENMAFAGHRDWRLPNAKELQYIVDYTRSPDTTDSPAIDPVFKTSEIINEAGQKDYPYFWTGTTHLEGSVPRMAVYISFGRAIGQMHGQTMDVHGAGAQRSDSKTGQARLGMGPQGDANRVLNYVRLVRGGNVQKAAGQYTKGKNAFPYKIRVEKNTVTADQSQEQYQSGQEGQPGQMRSGNTGRQTGGTKENSFFRRFDKNQDGKVSKSEFDGPQDHFSRLDRNQDGYISSDEAPTGPPPPGKYNDQTESQTGKTHKAQTGF